MSVFDFVAPFRRTERNPSPPAAPAALSVAERAQLLERRKAELERREAAVRQKEADLYRRQAAASVADEQATLAKAGEIARLAEAHQKEQLAFGHPVSFADAVTYVTREKGAAARQRREAEAKAAADEERAFGRAVDDIAARAERYQRKMRETYGQEVTIAEAVAAVTKGKAA